MSDALKRRYLGAPPFSGEKRRRIAIKPECAMALDEINRILVSRGCAPLKRLGTRDGWELAAIEPYPAFYNDHYIIHRFIAKKPGTNEYCYYDIQDSGTGHCMVIAIVPAPRDEDILVVLVRQSRAPLEGSYLTELPRAGTPFMGNFTSFGGYGEIASSNIVSLEDWKDETKVSAAGLPLGVRNLVRRELSPLVKAQVATKRIVSLGIYPVNTGRSREFVHVYLFELDISMDALRAIRSTSSNWTLKYHTVGEMLDAPDMLAGDPDSAAGFVRLLAWLRRRRHEARKDHA